MENTYTRAREIGATARGRRTLPHRHRPSSLIELERFTRNEAPVCVPQRPILVTPIVAHAPLCCTHTHTNITAVQSRHSGRYCLLTLFVGIVWRGVARLKPGHAERTVPAWSLEVSNGRGLHSCNRDDGVGPVAQTAHRASRR